MVIKKVRFYCMKLEKYGDKDSVILRIYWVRGILSLIPVAKMNHPSRLTTSLCFKFLLWGKPSGLLIPAFPFKPEARK